MVIEFTAPQYNISFHNEKSREVGKLDWGTGAFEFTGNAGESAKVFFDFLKPMINDYLLARDNKVKE